MDKPNNVTIDDELLTLKTGISNRLTIQLISVSNLDSNGIPTDYKEETIRADLINNASEKIKEIYFFKPNPNCYWQFQLSGRFNTIPVRFEKGKWYIIWSNEFTEGIFSNIHYHFFIYKDSLEKLHLYKSSIALSPV